MRNSSRPIAPEKQVRRLEKKHASLKEQVAELEARRSLTASETLAVQSLKKKKLATKDALLMARKSLVVQG